MTTKVSKEIAEDIFREGAEAYENWVSISYLENVIEELFDEWLGNQTKTSQEEIEYC